MRARVPGARLQAVGWVPGRRLRWHKRGSDGSGKCSIGAAGEGAPPLRGVLYSVPAGEWAHLDRVEGLGAGYLRERITVQTEGGPREAWTYVAMEPFVDDTLRPFRWYRRLVVAGARAHRLPRPYVAALRAQGAWLDPQPRRARDNLGSLAAARRPPC
jgi:gamma-glutamylcyclotransferase (GGCT)/AIG2-like uncharacterized protein YtfP